MAALCLVAPSLAAGPAAAQDDAPVLFIDISTGLYYEDGLNEDDEIEWRTRLGVGYFTSTHNQRLSFQTGVTARAGEERHDLIDPFATITYARFSRDTEISTEPKPSRQGSGCAW